METLSLARGIFWSVAVSALLGALCFSQPLQRVRLTIAPAGGYSAPADQPERTALAVAGGGGQEPAAPVMTEVERKQDQARRDYIGKYAPVAVAEMRNPDFGIPASITLAQGLLESKAGQSELARNANNHFGIKCFSRFCKKGHCVNATDDTHKDFFLKFPSVWRSYREHSKLLSGKRYKQPAGTDYKTWAQALERSGYATQKGYAAALIRLIQLYRLDRYDER